MNETGYFRRETDAGAAAAGPRRVVAWRAVGPWIERAAANLDPGYFALVMATGIVSNAFFLQNYRPLSDALFAVNLVAYPWLWLLTAWRAARCRRALWTDLLDPSRVFLFFTTVAATDVFGMSVGLRGFAGVALVLWLVTLALWLALTYFGFAVLLFHNHEKRADVIGGAWLNAIVGTQSLVIVGGALALPAAHLGPQAFILLPMLWAIGLVLYGILIVLICQRFFFSAVAPDEVAPPLWVVMGAAAISVNAGLILLTDGGVTPFVRSLQPFLGGTTLAVWAWATWWIPLLLLLGLWKHGARHVCGGDLAAVALCRCPGARHLVVRDGLDRARRLVRDGGRIARFGLAQSEAWGGDNRLARPLIGRATPPNTATKRQGRKPIRPLGNIPS